MLADHTFITSYTLQATLYLAPEYYAAKRRSVRWLNLLSSLLNHVAGGVVLTAPAHALCDI